MVSRRRFESIAVDQPTAAPSAADLVDKEETLREPELIRVEIIRTPKERRYLVVLRTPLMHVGDEERRVIVATEVIWNPDLVNALHAGSWSVDQESQQLWRRLARMYREEAFLQVELEVLATREEADRVGLALCFPDRGVESPCSERRRW